MHKILLLVLILCCTAYARLNNEYDADRGPTLGLYGTAGSLAYDVAEIEYHLHNREIWYGAGAANGTGVSTSITSWVLTAGGQANTFGEFVQLGTGQIAVTDYPGTTHFDVHAVFVSDVNQADATYLVELWQGATTTASAHIMTSFPYRVGATVGESQRQEIKSVRIPVGMKTWARVKCSTAGKTISFLVGLHTYPGI
jgi:hypothetical protein